MLPYQLEITTFQSHFYNLTNSILIQNEEKTYFKGDFGKHQRIKRENFDHLKPDNFDHFTTNFKGPQLIKRCD